MTEPRVIAEIRSHKELVDVMRARVVALDTTHEAVGELAGLPARYANKIFAGMKRLGPASLELLCAALALKLHVVEDAEMLVRIAPRLVRRKYAHAEMPTRRKRRKSPFRGNSAWGRWMRARATLSESEDEREAHARRAAKARWRRPRQPARAALPEAGTHAAV
jgi:hypothetical protein